MDVTPVCYSIDYLRASLTTFREEGIFPSSIWRRGFDRGNLMDLFLERHFAEGIWERHFDGGDLKEAIWRSVKEWHFDTKIWRGRFEGGILGVPSGNTWRTIFDEPIMTGSRWRTDFEELYFTDVFWWREKRGKLGGAIWRMPFGRGNTTGKKRMFFGGKILREKNITTKLTEAFWRTPFGGREMSLILTD